MFKVIVSKDVIASCIDAVDPLVDECKLHPNEDEFRIRAVDPANVGMVDTSLQAGAFESYEVDGGVLGINLNRFKKVVSMANSGDLINMELNEQTRQLEIKFNGLSYTLSLIDPKTIREEPDIPDLDLPAKVVFEGSQLDQGLKAADMVSDHITLRVNDEANSFIIEAEGDTDDMDLELGEDDLIDITPGYAHSLFSLDYLKDMKKPIPSDGEVTAILGEEFPVKLSYNYAEGLGQTTYMLAPRVSSD